MKTTFREWVLAHRKKGVEVNRSRLAEEAVNKVPELVIPVIQDEIDDILRSLVRDEEAKVVDDFVQRVARMKASPSEKEMMAEKAVEGIRRLLSEKVATGRGTLVSLGAMDRDEHVKRAAFLRAMAASTLKTAEFHEAAVRLLDAKGVRTLNDLTDSGEADGLLEQYPIAGD